MSQTSVTGRPQWTQEIRSRVLGFPAFANGVPSSDETLTAIDAGNGPLSLSRLFSHDSSFRGRKGA